ncbi:MAG TPA: hypothetical protein VNC41_07500, partial [Acidimicrobiia bacterium]|nr:hypothetical protein [Acidimicrobiia bacterium]
MATPHLHADRGLHPSESGLPFRSEPAMRFQKTNFSDYLKVPEPVPAEPELSTAAPEADDLVDAETVAEQLE